MKTFVTELKAIDPKDGELKMWAGQHILADTFEEAQQICETTCGYLTVIGELVAESA